MSTLNELVNDAEKVSLSEDDIMNITMNETKIVGYTDLAKCKDITNLLSPHNNFILFYETTSLYEGHWVCVLYHPNTATIEFFDSYGMMDREILGYAPTSDKYVNGVPLLTALIQKACSEYGLNFVYNDRRFQSKNNQMATCGRYASMRSRFKALSLTRFQALISGNQYPPDYIVSAMTVMFSPDADKYISGK